jgi:hypothetical protein
MAGWQPIGHWNSTTLPNSTGADTVVLHKVNIDRLKQFFLGKLINEIDGKTGDVVNNRLNQPFNRLSCSLEFAIPALILSQKLLCLLAEADHIFQTACRTLARASIRVRRGVISLV